MKKMLICTLFFFLTMLFPLAVGASDATSSTSDTVSEYDFEDQLKASGADELTDELPEETKELLRKLGIDSIQPDSLLGHRRQRRYNPHRYRQRKCERST